MTAATAERVDLAIGRMSCAACVARVERSLNDLDGVEATVNLATEQAAVRFDRTVVEVADLVRAVEASDTRRCRRTPLRRVRASRRGLGSPSAFS